MAATHTDADWPLTFVTPTPWSVLGLEDRESTLLRVAGIISAESLYLRLLDPGQRLLLSRYLEATEKELIDWRRVLVERVPSLAAARPCEVGPLAFGCQDIEPEERSEERAYLDDFDDMISGYDWAAHDHEHIDLRADLPGPVSQGARGFCWAFAAVAGTEGMLGLSKGSEAFVVQVAKNDIGDPWPNDDGGSSVVAAKAMIEYGIPEESDYPMTLDLSIHERPPDWVYERAISHRLGDYLVFGDRYGFGIDAVAAALRGDAAFPGRPLAISVPVYPSIRAVGSDGLLPDPLPGEEPIGYHAMSIVGVTLVQVEGYDLPYLIVRNSWGKQWGDRGHCYLSERYLNEHARRLLAVFTT
ncbi:MAG: C1 family peptidase, partial [Lentisphaerae bacterium]|nr:C1 family peptidase [Lentisphaerota bacterium]